MSHLEVLLARRCKREGKPLDSDNALLREIALQMHADAARAHREFVDSGTMDADAFWHGHAQEIAKAAEFVINHGDMRSASEHATTALKNRSLEFCDGAIAAAHEELGGAPPREFWEALVRFSAEKMRARELSLVSLLEDEP